MSKPTAQIKTTELFGEDGPRILQYPDEIYLTDGGQLHTLSAAQLTTLGNEEGASQGKPRI